MNRAEKANNILKNRIRFKKEVPLVATFKTFQLQPFLYEALAEINFNEPTEVQQRLIPVIKKGKNVIGQSQTGSGKTHTFLLPLFDRLDPARLEVQAVITAPSRELAQQIYQAALQLAKHSPKEIRVMNLVGGTDKQRQITKLQKQQPHIVIGTPGRILDMMNEQVLKVYTADYLVVDEADMTLDLGFLPEVDKIAGSLGEELQMLIFSATIPEKLKPFLRKYAENPVMEQIEPKSVIASTIENWLISSKSQSKEKIVYDLLTIGHPYLAIIFANTKQRVDELTAYLKENGLKVAKIHGDVPPRERKRLMKQIQQLDFQYVVATDLAARGIDIEGVSHVINVDIPSELEFFIHRVGRTGRNGLKGTAITLYEPGEEALIAEIEELGIHFEPKTLAHGEIVASHDRNRRKKREKSTVELDPTMIGLVKKTKKKVKPGYKKKIKRAIAQNAQQKRRAEKKSQERAKRKARKQQY